MSLDFLNIPHMYRLNRNKRAKIFKFLETNMNIILSDLGLYMDILDTKSTINRRKTWRKKTIDQ